MPDREKIFKSIRSALHSLTARTPYPDWEEDVAVSRNHPEFSSLWELFSYKLRQVNGIPLHGIDRLGEYLRRNKRRTGYCDPSLAEKIQNLPSFQGISLETEYAGKDYDYYEFGITRASGAIAETGTLILTDRMTASRLGALAPWTHAAILEPARLWPDFPTARAMVMDDDPSIIFVTGPSKTADVEGILVEGVHGPGEQICCLLEEPS